MTTPNAYTPVNWDELNALPALTGLYGKEIIAEKTSEIQRLETSKMLQIITSAAPEQYTALINSKMPIAHQVYFIRVSSLISYLTET